MTEKFKWAKMTKPDHSQIRDGDIREVTLPVRCYFTWSDKIAKEIDEEGNVLEYTSGFIMNVLEDDIIYRGEETRFLYQAIKIRK